MKNDDDEDIYVNSSDKVIISQYDNDWYNAPHVDTENTLRSGGNVFYHKEGTAGSIKKKQREREREREKGLKSSVLYLSLIHISL